MSSRKGKIDLDEDDYYEEDYDYDGNEDEYEEEEEEKPKKKDKKKNKKEKEEKEKQKKEEIKPKEQKKEENKPKEQKKNDNQKKIINVKDYNDKKTYPKIDYGKQFTDNKEKPTINLVIIGHVDSGKSTMIGHLLCLLGVIDNKSFQQNQKGKPKKGEEKSTINYANATDEASDERERGVTMGTGFKTFETKTKKIISMDAPGHQDFIPVMIEGTSAADYALLIIDSGLQAFSAGFFREGQTREHALLAKTLGVNQLIVAINKLEIFDWSKDRYDEIVEDLKKFLIGELNFDEKKIIFLPVSGLTGDNLLKPISSKGGDWYKGPTLIDIIDELEPPQRAIDAPVRFIISDITKNPINGLQGLNLYGKLETGVITVNTEYLVLPSGNKEKVKSIALDKNNVKYITPGQQAEILLDLSKNSKEERKFEPGNILCSEKYPVPCIKKFKANIKTYDLKVPITLGKKMMFYLQGQKSQITIKKIEKIYNEGSEITKKNSRFIPKNFYADIIIESESIICAELFCVNKKLSTFTLRSSGETEAMGYITEFIE